MHSKSDNIRIMMSVKWKKKFTKLFDLLKNRYQNNLESMRDSAFIFEYVQLLYYKCHKINLNCGGSYIDSPDWIKNKKATINLIDKTITNAFNML